MLYDACARKTHDKRGIAYGPEGLYGSPGILEAGRLSVFWGLGFRGVSRDACEKLTRNQRIRTRVVS